MKHVVTLLATVLSLSSTSYGATLVHQYQLNGTLADDFGGPALVSGGGTLGPANYSFSAGQGLSLSDGLPNAFDYSIEMIVNFSNLAPFQYRKIIDFKNLTSDWGLYTHSNSLTFYGGTVPGPSDALSNNVDARIILTRDDSTDLVSFYVNGAIQGSFTDSTDIAEFTFANNIIHFFRNDTVQSGEDPTGVVDLIRIYNGALTISEVAALDGPTPVPEPTSLLLASCATALFGAHRFRRRRKSAAAA